MAEYHLEVIASDGRVCDIGTFESEEQLERWAKDCRGSLDDYEEEG